MVFRTHDGPKNHVLPYICTPYLVLITTVCSLVTVVPAVLRGGICYGIQNPRWTQKTCIPLYLHSMFGSDYYQYSIFPRNDCKYRQYYGGPYHTTVIRTQYGPKKRVYPMFTRHVWFRLLCVPPPGNSLRALSQRRLSARSIAGCTLKPAY